MDLESGKLQVRRQLTRTRAGLSFAAPKRGRSCGVRLTASASEALKAHKATQNGERLEIGLLWQEGGLVFTTEKGTPLDVGNLT